MCPPSSAKRLPWTRGNEAPRDLGFFHESRLKGGGRVAALLSLLLGPWLSGCPLAKSEPPSPPPAVDGEVAFRHAAAVYRLGPRPSGSPGALANLEYLQREIAAVGLTPVIDEWPEQTLAGPLTFRNLRVDIPGRQDDRFILLGCHYDTKRLTTIPDFAGANDGASGVGAMLAMIQAIAAHPEPPPCHLRLLFFDGEECQNEYDADDGLHGSRRHAAQLQAAGQVEACLAVIILDMIGDRDLTLTLPAGADPQLVRVLQDLAASTGQARLLKPYGNDLLDDHTPFQRLGIPTLDLIDFEYGPGNRYWHSPGDTLDKLSPASLKATADLALALVWALPARPEAPRPSLPTTQNPP